MTVVETAAGRVVGVRDGSIRSYLGIPYAAAPIGPNRFRLPRPAAPWTGERDATTQGSRCPQVPSMMVPAGAPEDEDCLNLNIWTPAAPGDALPVMVWIHGGSFTTGSGTIAWYNGARLATRGVVVVTLNYRLGALGFLHLAPIGGERYAGSANLGLADQSLALAWVAANIGAFGGDPSNVTLFGESAGAMSVSCHPAMPLSAGLFRRMIAQSGAADHCQTAESAERNAGIVLDHLGVGAANLDRLETLPVEAFVTAVPKAEAAVGRTELPLPFRPTVEPAVLPVAPIDGYRRGAASHIDMILGTTAEEMKLFTLMAALAGAGGELDDERLHRRVARVAEFRGTVADAGEIVATYRRRGLDRPAEVWAALGTDLTFRVPALAMADAASSGGSSVRVYRFDEPSTAFDGALGAAHGMEIPYVFDNLHQPGVDAMLGPVDSEKMRLAASVADAWTSFATDGNPHVRGLDAWPEWTSVDPSLVVGRPPEVVPGLDADVRTLWM